MHPSKPLVALVLALSACVGDSTGDVARVADQSLTQEQLLEYMAGMGRPAAGTYAVADAVAEGWLDLALVAEAAADGLTPGDTALQREVFAPIVRAEHLRRLQNALAVTRDPVTDEELERRYRGDSLRVYQRVLVQVADWRDRALVGTRRARADSILALVQAGAPFERLAMELSEGPNAATGGFLDVVTRDEVPATFRDSLWALEPGGVSPVLSADPGFQILRRPPFAEVRNRLAAHLLREAGARADSLLADSLAAAHGMTVLPQTAARLREVLTNPDSLGADTAWVMGFEEGGVAPEEAWLWLAALPDPVRLSLARASDVDLESAARTLARNELLYRMARARGIEVGAADLAEPRAEFTTAADSLFATFAAADPSTRAQIVDSIVGSVLSGEPTRLLPAGLAPALRRRVPHALDRDALARVAREASYRITADSLASGG
jgi:hypothetical protein